MHKAINSKCSKKQLFSGYPKSIPSRKAGLDPVRKKGRKNVVQMKERATIQMNGNTRPVWIVPSPLPVLGAGGPITGAASPLTA